MEKKRTTSLHRRKNKKSGREKDEGENRREEDSDAEMRRLQ